jgi:hypothetical protein
MSRIDTLKRLVACDEFDASAASPYDPHRAQQLI